MGVRYSMLQTPIRVNERQYGGAQRYAVMDYERLDETLALARAWHGVDPFDAVVSFTEYGLEPASRVAADLGVAGDNLAAVRVTRSKPATRALLNKHGLSPVRHRSCASVADARDFQRELGGCPIMLKPPAGGLSEGVYLVETPEQLDERWAWTQGFTDEAILAEEFLSGPEYSVESISRNGVHEVVVITEKLTTEVPRFIELGHQVPARLGEAAWEGIVDLVTRFLNVIGQRTGPAHTEIRMTATGPKIIESQTRFGGDQIWELCELVSGVDLMSETIASLLGLPAPDRVPAAAAAAIRFFSYEDVHVVDVAGITAARSAPGVVRVLCTLTPGQDLHALVSSDSRQGYVLAVGDNVETAVARATAAHDLVQVATEARHG
ncbi:ATP-grasp domain-containing protein [Salinispora oceanensis]|uniref:ATP-grasp domain-containing protein n=1 Tax=Salinispora oceanensis TaxID=1050199 RepID=UPI001CC77719|nr:ATP-grasp domain-containing protein [Salinispora oceanensis]